MTTLWWSYFLMCIVWTMWGLLALSVMVGVLKQALVSGVCTILQEHIRLRTQFLKEFDAQMQEETLKSRTKSSVYN
jgi:hypothetical protein